jgi:type I thyroxine 5'-deiodinase
MDSNEKEDVCYLQPRTLADRVAIANDFVKRFHYDVPIAVDDMANSAESAYAAWPERLYVVDENGKVAFKGGVGPFGYHPEEVEAWLEKRFPRVKQKS